MYSTNLKNNVGFLCLSVSAVRLFHLCWVLASQIASVSLENARLDVSANVQVILVVMLTHLDAQSVSVFAMPFPDEERAFMVDRIHQQLFSLRAA